MALTPRAAAIVVELLRGRTVAETAASVGCDVDHAGAIGRRLVDVGLAAPQPPSTTGNPLAVGDVAAVIPAHNAAGTIGSTIASLVGVDEIIVVDDGSIDDTAAVAASCGATVLRHDRARGPAAARNAGIGRTDADVVVLLDSDADAEPGWLDVLLAHLADESVGGVAPRVTTPADHSMLGRYEAEASVLDRGTEGGLVRPDGTVTFVSTTALVVRREVWRTLGGFDEDLRFGEDLDFVWRAAELGRPMVYEPASLVRHHQRSSLRSHLVNRYRYGTAGGPLSRRHDGHPRAGLAPPVLVASGAAAVVGWTRLSAGLAAVSAATVTMRFHASGASTPAALRGSMVATVRSGRGLAGAVSSSWMPVAVALAAVHRPARWPVLGAIVARQAIALAQRRRPRSASVPGGTWVLLRLAEDLALSLGVIGGCVRARTTGPMRPGRPPGPTTETSVLGAELILP